MDHRPGPIGPRTGDAFGQALLDAHRGVGGTYVVERTDGYVDVETGADNLAGQTDWPTWDSKALDLVSGRVLDVGAGAGRHSLVLQIRGDKPTALDTSPGAIEVCRQRGVEHTFHGDLPTFAMASPPPFDAAILMGNNLGLLGSRDESHKVFGTLDRLLAPGGVVVGTCLDPYLTNDKDHLALHEKNRQAGLLPGQLTLRVRYRYLATDWFNYLFVSPNELHDLALECGWRVDETTEPDPIYLATLRRL